MEGTLGREWRIEAEGARDIMLRDRASVRLAGLLGLLAAPWLEQLCGTGDQTSP